MAKKLISDWERFFNKVNKTDSCWEWTAGTDNDGYGLFGYRMDGKKRQWRAHRWIMSQTKGLDTQNPIVMHTCDNPKCVNPEHLRNGTQLENQRDKWRKGRSTWQIERGYQYHGEKYGES